MIQQDSSDPTGVVAVPPPRHGQQTGTLTRSRNRKANAALEMRLAGATWEQIAASLGFPSARAALVATEKALERQLNDQADRDQMRRMAGARLERLLRGVWTKAIDPEHPDQMTAVSKAREIIAQHAKLYGLDAPTEIVVHEPTRAELEAWVTAVVSGSALAVQEYDIITGEVVDAVPTQ